MNGHNPVEVDALIRILLHHLKLGVIHHHVGTRPLRPPINHQPMPLYDHLFHPMRVEPPTDEPPPKGARLLFLDEDIEHLLKTPDPFQGRLLDHATHANSVVRRIVRDMVKLRPILIPMRVVSEQTTHGIDANPLQRPQPVAG